MIKVYPAHCDTLAFMHGNCALQKKPVSNADTV